MTSYIRVDVPYACGDAPPAIIIKLPEPPTATGGVTDTVFFLLFFAWVVTCVTFTVRFTLLAAVCALRARESSQSTVCDSWTVTHIQSWQIFYR
jgi:hypothetical protein